MSLLPKSRAARRRLTMIAAIAPVIALSAGLTLYGLRGSISYFYTPAQAKAAHVPSGRAIQLGGLVERGSVRSLGAGRIEFTVADRLMAMPVEYSGALPDLFREGQGVVAVGAFQRDGLFVATQILAKHDEKYMPKALADSLKAQGEWRGDGKPPAYGSKSVGL
jgi:cytochrome c-type biogenesis protein CcmE